MPASGAARPVFRSSKSAPLSPPEVCIVPMTPPIERDRLEQSPKCAEEAEEDEEPREIAQDLPPFIKPRLEGIEQRALIERSEALDLAGERALERAEEIGRDAGGRCGRTQLGVRPAHLASDLPKGMKSEHDAGDERDDDHRVQHWICEKRREDALLQESHGDPA